MKAKILKLISISLVLLLLINVAGCIMGSGTRGKPIGDFYVVFNEEEGTCKINDLTEQGAAKDVLVFPKEIEGYSVIGFDVSYGGCTNDRHQFFTPKANKLFCETFILKPGGVNLFFQNYINKIILLFINDFENVTIVRIENPIKQDYYLKSNITITEKRNAYLKDVKFYNANVSYYYNYEREDGEEYYWIDDYDGDETVSYIPEDPVREGFTFAGWYKEPECINVWDFKTDKIPLKEYDEEGNYLYKETCLYAKWVENI